MFCEKHKKFFYDEGRERNVDNTTFQQAWKYPKIGLRSGCMLGLTVLTVKQIWPYYGLYRPRTFSSSPLSSSRK